MKWLALLAIVFIELFVNCEGVPPYGNAEYEYTSAYLSKLQRSNKLFPILKETLHNTTNYLMNKFETAYKDVVKHLHVIINNLKELIEERIDDEDNNECVGECTAETSDGQTQQPIENEETEKATKILSKADTTTESDEYDYEYDENDD